MYGSLVINGLVGTLEEKSIVENSNNVNSNLNNFSCKTILDSGGSNGSGLYTLNYNGSDIEHYCDMVTNGGGWTLIDTSLDNNQNSLTPYASLAQNSKKIAHTQSPSNTPSNITYNNYVMYDIPNPSVVTFDNNEIGSAIAVSNVISNTNLISNYYTNDKSLGFNYSGYSYYGITDTTAANNFSHYAFVNGSGNPWSITFNYGGYGKSGYFSTYLK